MKPWAMFHRFSTTCDGRMCARAFHQGSQRDVTRLPGVFTALPLPRWHRYTCIPHSMDISGRLCCYSRTVVRDLALVRGSRRVNGTRHQDRTATASPSREPREKVHSHRSFPLEDPTSTKKKNRSFFPFIARPGSCIRGFAAVVACEHQVHLQ